MSKTKKLRCRQLTPVESRMESSSFRSCKEDAKDNRWVVHIRDFQDEHGPIFEVKTPRSGALEPWRVAQAIAPQCSERNGWLTMTEYKAGSATFAAIFRVGHLNGRGHEICMHSTDSKRCPVQGQVFATARKLLKGEP